MLALRCCTSAPPVAPGSLPAGTRVLTPGGSGSRVYLFGTSHVSPTAHADIRRLLELTRPRAVVLEACVARLPALLPRSVPVQWRFADVSLHGVPEEPVAGHARVEALLQALSTRAGDNGATAESIASDLQTLLDTGLFASADVSLEKARFAGFSRSTLAPCCAAQALRFSLTPRELPPFEHYAVALAPELAQHGYPPPVTSGECAEGAPHLPWLPAFYVTFQALCQAAEAHRDDLGQGELPALEVCCLAREAVAAAGGASGTWPPVAVRFEREASRPETLIISLDVPNPGQSHSWQAAGADALSVERPSPTEMRATTRHLRDALAPPSPPGAPLRRARSRVAALDVALGGIAWAPAAALAAAVALRLGVSVGDDMRAALGEAVSAGVPLILLADRPLRATARRLGAALRRAWRSLFAIVGGAALALCAWPRAVLALAVLSALALALTPRRVLLAHIERAAHLLPAMPPDAVEAILGERDRCITAHLHVLAASGSPLPHAPLLVASEEEDSYAFVGLRDAGCPERVVEEGAIVAVVGAAHVRGILRAWTARGGTVENMCANT